MPPRPRALVPSRSAPGPSGISRFPPADGICLFFAADGPHKRLLFSNKWSEHVYFDLISRDLAWIMITKGQSECWAAAPPQRTAVRNLLKVANGLVSVRLN
jgi:hypothetical protein